MASTITSEAAALIGRAGGLKRSEKKTAANKQNGRLGGRPRDDGRRVVYRISWVMNESSGLFPQKFTSRKVAMRVARAWRKEMMDLDSDQETVRARYGWLLVEEDAT